MRIGVEVLEHEMIRLLQFEEFVVVVGLGGESLEANAAGFGLGRLSHFEVFVGNGGRIRCWRRGRDSEVEIALERVGRRRRHERRLLEIA